MSAAARSFAAIWFVLAAAARRASLPGRSDTLFHPEMILRFETSRRADGRDPGGIYVRQLPRTFGPALAMRAGMTRIHVLADPDTISAQARTYAEYRVFSALTRHAINFRRARVRLRNGDGTGTYGRVSCALCVALDPSGSVRVRVTAPHEYAAINRAVERLDDARGRRIEQRHAS